MAFWLSFSLSHWLQSVRHWSHLKPISCTSLHIQWPSAAQNCSLFNVCIVSPQLCFLLSSSSLLNNFSSIFSCNLMLQTVLVNVYFVRLFWSWMKPDCGQLTDWLTDVGSQLLYGLIQSSSLSPFSRIITPFFLVSTTLNSLHSTAAAQSQHTSAETLTPAFSN